MLRRKRRVVKKKRMWVRKVFAERQQKGLFNILVKDLPLHDDDFFSEVFE